MSERRSPIEQEAFWDGHSFQDDCPPLLEPKVVRKACAVGCLLFPYAIPIAVVEMMRESKIDKDAYKQLKEFLSLMPDTPVKTLTKGEIFDPKNYPVGTVLRISRTSEAHRHFAERKFWGLIAQDQHKEDMVVAYDNEQLSDVDPPFGPHRFSGEIEVGNVRHTIIGNLQTLVKFNRIEVYQYGRGVRERIPEKKKATNAILRRA